MNDLALWQQLKEGEKKALERIYQQEVRALLNYGKKFSKDAQLVEDSVQDLFIELWRNRSTLGKTDSIRRYLFVSLRRKIIRQIERTKKRVSEGELVDSHFEAVISIEEQIIGSEVSTAQSTKLKQAFETLSKRQQEAVYLKYYAGMDYEDIGEILEINYQSVRNLVSNALKALRKTMMIVIFVLLSSTLTFGGILRCWCPHQQHPLEERCG